MKKNYLFFLLFLSPTLLLAQNSGSSFTDSLNNLFQPLLNFLDAVLFWDPFKALGIDLGTKVPVIIIWLIFGATFFTIYFKFRNNFV